jgi:UDP-3-O-[3-hydroxymyristoyl] glucosamine N-acyltransferase
MNISDIAKLINAEIVAPDAALSANVEIIRLAPIDKAGAGDLTFLANPQYAKFAASTKASALIVSKPLDLPHVVQLIHAEPYACFAKVAQRYHKAPQPEAGISPAASIHKEARIGSSVCIAAGVHIDADAVIGDHVVLYPGVVIGRGVRVGSHTIIHPNVVIYYDCIVGSHCIIHAGSVIGSDGFGYAVTKEETIKIPQVGNVVIGDDVEIGGLCTIDRAAMGSTKIGRGTKLDSRVQIAHNCEVGERCMFSAFSGMAGSSKVGDRVTLGGYAGIGGHTQVASDSIIGAMTGVVTSIEKSGSYVGFPAVPAMQWRRQQVYIQRLGEFEKRIRELEAALKKSADPT